jgi:hypothetical protein
VTDFAENGITHSNQRIWIVNEPIFMKALSIIEKDKINKKIKVACRAGNYVVLYIFLHF